MTFKPMPILTLCSIASFALLIWLGNWQYGRFLEKKARGPVEAEQFSDVSVDIDVSNPGMAQQVYGIVDGEAVWRRYVPGRVSGEGPVVMVLWDATSGTQPVDLPISDTGPYEREGNDFVRAPQTGGLAGSSEPDRNMWYGFNGPAMLENLGYDETNSRVVESNVITLRLAEDTSRSRRTLNPYVSAEVRDPLPPERHFGYALTWWGLAVGLVGVYIAFHRAQGRLSFGSKK